MKANNFSSISNNIDELDNVTKLTNFVTDVIDCNTKLLKMIAELFEHQKRLEDKVNLLYFHAMPLYEDKTKEYEM